MVNNIKNILKPKSEEDIINDLSKLSKQDLDEFFSNIINNSNVSNISNIKLLLKYGADINYRNKIGWTALHYAVYYDKDEITEILLKHKANPNVMTYSGLTPLKLALKFNKRIINMLKLYGAVS